METTRLGKTGLKVSRICLGCMTYGSPNWRDWVLGEEESRPFIRRALESGINFFDTADVYSVGRSEEIVGKALKDMAKRDNVVLATKVCGVMSDDVNDRGLSRKHIMSSIDNSLRRLQTDYVDLYQIHRFDPTTPVEETIEALNDVVKAGKARYVGASSMYAWQFSKYLYTQEKLGAAKFVSMQNFYNLVYREEEREMVPLCRDQGIGMIPWSPLARGFLAGNRSRDGEAQTTRAKSDANILTAQAFRDSDYAIRDRLNEMATAKGVSAAQLALAWLIHNPVVSAPIVGASKMKHLDDAIAAASIKLTDDEAKALSKGYETRRIMGHQ
ncbi:MAG: aldo/keto reductase [Alphaproteobacteria bacterium]|nr:aldo/keto reductase [Alphaproteobacteria bacterium]MBL6937388.1 aldo/keto reductase [Alphaproteobacteria bacterium]MBL7096050.1 aldo/keto reductase [Alphaproteobacteria bacterium]